MALFVTQKRRKPWLLRPKMHLNPPGTLTYSILFYILFYIQQQKHFKYLRVVVDESLSRSNHVSYVASRAYPKLKLLKRISSFLSPAILVSIYL